ncbi:MAG: citronellyl-CoA synthetase [Pseudomonas sp.]
MTSHGKWIKAYGGFGHAGLALENTDVLCLTLPLYHSNAVTVSWGSALAGGAALALRRKFSASTFWKDVAYYNATCFAYIGELCRYLLNQPECAEEKKQPDLHDRQRFAASHLERVQNPLRGAAYYRILCF